MIDTSQARRENLHTDLLDRVADGDYVAFSTLYFELYRPIHRYTRMLLTDAIDAQNVTAAAFVEVWHSARSYQRHGSEGQTVLRWAMAIARRRCLKLAKRPQQDGAQRSQQDGAQRPQQDGAQRPQQGGARHMTIVSPDKHLKCQLDLLLAASGARQTATCRCMDG
jgi:DNA-directed RNA polymerase specialized sigma24 family protein